MIERSKFSSRLSPADAGAIRSAPLSTRNADLARKFGVSATTIARIRRGVTWPVEQPVHVTLRLPRGAAEALESASARRGLTAAKLAADIIVRWSSSRDAGGEEQGPGAT